MKKYAAMIWFEEDKEAEFQFRLLSRNLWEEHVNYISRIIASILADVPALDALMIRIDNNSTTIANMLIPYYGEADATKFGDLIKAHVANGIATVRAIKAGTDITELKAASLANGEEIATFLNSLDPINWPHDVFLDMWKMHLDCTADQATYRLQGMWTEDIAAYDACRVGIIEIADVFSAGIICEFPEKFVKQITF